MEKDRETIFLRKRFGFVKMALQTGAHLLPAFAFGQSRMCVSLPSAICACSVMLPRLTRLRGAATSMRGRGRRCCLRPRRGCCRSFSALRRCASGDAGAAPCRSQCRCTWCWAAPSACSKARAAAAARMAA